MLKSLLKSVVTRKPVQRILPRTYQQNQQGNYGGFTKNGKGPGKLGKGSSIIYEFDEKIKSDKKNVKTQIMKVIHTSNNQKKTKTMSY